MTEHAGSALHDPDLTFCMHCQYLVMLDPEGGFLHLDVVHDAIFKECRNEYGQVMGFEATPAPTLKGPMPDRARTAAPHVVAPGTGQGRHRVNDWE